MLRECAEKLRFMHNFFSYSPNGNGKIKTKSLTLNRLCISRSCSRNNTNYHSINNNFIKKKKNDQMFKIK